MWFSPMWGWGRVLSSFKRASSKVVSTPTRSKCNTVTRLALYIVKYCLKWNLNTMCSMVSCRNEVIQQSQAIGYVLEFHIILSISIGRGKLRKSWIFNTSHLCQNMKSVNEYYWRKYCQVKGVLMLWNCKIILSIFRSIIFLVELL